MGGNNPRVAGSITVFFALYFPLFAAFVGTLFFLADYQISRIISRELLDSAASSTLSEFDRKIESKYGVYVYRGESDLKRSFAYYLKENLAHKGVLGLTEYESATVTARTEQSLADGAELRKQIESFMEYRRYEVWAEEVAENFDALWEKAENLFSAGDGETTGDSGTVPAWDDLFDSPIFILSDYVDSEDLLAQAGLTKADLPSFTYSIEDDDDEDVSDEEFAEILLEQLSEIGEELLLKADLVYYATGMLSDFSDTVAVTDGGEASLTLREQEKQAGFFQNEAEYLLKGSGSELKNVRAAKRRMVALRFLLNMAMLSSDPIMAEKVTNLAKDTGGEFGTVGVAVAAGIIITAWSWAEAELDYTHLVKGEKVPFLKSSTQWEIGSDTYIEPENGMDYSDYLCILLCLIPAETLVARIADLIFLEEEGEVPMEEYITAFSAEGLLKKGQRSYAFSLEKGY